MPELVYIVVHIVLIVYSGSILLLVYCRAMRANMVEVKTAETHNWLQRQLYVRKGQAICSDINNEIKDLAANKYHGGDMFQ